MGRGVSHPYIRIGISIIEKYTIINRSKIKRGKDNCLAPLDFDGT